MLYVSIVVGYAIIGVHLSAIAVQYDVDRVRWRHGCVDFTIVPIVICHHWYGAMATESCVTLHTAVDRRGLTCIISGE